MKLSSLRFQTFDVGTQLYLRGTYKNGEPLGIPLVWANPFLRAYSNIRWFLKQKIQFPYRRWRYK
jgi:hypothetical protein